ncbi:MAG: glycerophosphodiester phosphodiesterase [Actinobacteria bacterium]|nr:glycerophosphodiester phosphodiesterase [Actinomycetota bacterium]
MQALLAPGRVLRIGHRGAPFLAPENTLPSCRAAVAAGVDLVEIDVTALPDGTLVVAHSVDDARAPETPTLDEALAFFAEEATEVGVHLDLKADARAGELAGRITAHGLGSRCVVSSTSGAALRAFRTAGPGIAAGLTYPHDRHGISGRHGAAPLVAVGLRALRLTAAIRLPRLARSAGASAVFLQHAVVSPVAVRRLHDVGIAVLAWTVDEPADVLRARAAGVDGIISNDPSMLLATLST